MASRAIVLQQKTQRPVQFEITEPTREAVGTWITSAGLASEQALFPQQAPQLDAFIDSAVRPNR